MNGKKIKLLKNEDGETYSITSRPEYFPVRVKIPVDIDVKKHETTGYPIFVDEDDLLYYERGGYVYTNTTEALSAGETMVIDLKSLDVDITRANWICKTVENDKYILSTRKDGRGINKGGQIWTSDSLAGPWTKKLDVDTITGLGDCHFRFSNCWHHYDGHSDIIFVGTYGTYSESNPLPCNHVYKSMDEGATFELIFQAPIVTTTSNNHIHALAYSPWDGFLWVAHGDGDNRGMNYSPNFGKDWVTVSEGSFGEGGWQPSSVVPLMNQVALGTDNPIANGVLVWNKPNITEEVKLEYAHQKLGHDGLVQISRRGAQISSVEGYIPIMAGDATTSIFVTGDGGFSWHTAVTFTKGLPFEIGFTNPDSEGYVWGASMMKFKVSKWEEVTQWVKDRTIKTDGRWK